MRRQLVQVHSGEMSFASFVRATERKWKRLAETLVGRWDAGCAVDSEDVAQELLLAAWKHIPKWDSERADIERFVVFNACSEAKAWLHKQRGASTTTGRDRHPSRIPTVSATGEVDLAVEAAQEEIVDALMRLRFLVSAAKSVQQRAALTAVARTGSIDGAAIELKGYMTRQKVQRALVNVAAQIG